MSSLSHLVVLFCTFSPFLAHQDSEGGEWNTKDYLKREHSLVKPYQGKGKLFMSKAYCYAIEQGNYKPQARLGISIMCPKINFLPISNELMIHC